MRFLSVLALFLSACTGPDDTTSKADVDGDGWTTDEGDCDDADLAVFPTANEIWYDGVDQNCDGNDDDQDLDGVGFSAGDCDDTDAAVLPGAVELCDGVDNDCDGTSDVDAIDGVSGWSDADGDGFGNPAARLEGCVQPDSALVDNDDDCDDEASTINPDAEEVCDGLDNNCDSEVDEGVSGTLSFYADVDMDGFGDPGVSVTGCAPPEGFVDNDGDCNDGDAAVHPDVEELCDEVDQNCDGDATTGAVDAASWFTDADADGFGADDSLVLSCVAPEGAIAVGEDCDDADATVNPAGGELCDGVDNDCDGAVDIGATDAATWYTDEDVDGYGAASAGTSCAQPAGTAPIEGDCDDTDASISPSAPELCDGVDNDCSGAVDDGGSGGGIAYVDADSDGYGDPTSAEAWACEAPAGSVDNGEDCDDADGAINPGATERCDGVDNDCDSDVDGAGATDGSTWYADADGDGFGDGASSTEACDAPPGTVADDRDCDDGAPAVNPDGVESCNALDDDCDGATDEAGAIDETIWYLDLDSDSFGDDATAVFACDAPAETIEVGGDCDDTNGSVNPEAEELCDGLDNNCVDGVDDEVGTASYEDTTGGFIDLTEILAAGRSTAPVVIGDQSAYNFVASSGTVHLCEGDWYAKFVTATAGTVLTVSGAGADLTSVSSGGTTSGSPGSIFAASNTTMVVEDLTITGGIGSSSSKGGAIIASQTTGSANPVTPNMTLRGVVVSGNATEYGGGIALNSYGWLSLEDSLVLDNSASVAGGGIWMQSSGKVTCSASSIGLAGVLENTAPSGGGVYFSSSTSGSVTSTGCDWGTDASGDDNSSYDIQVSTTANKYCYGNASSLSEVVSCSAGVCTATTDTTCP